MANFIVRAKQDSSGVCDFLKRVVEGCLCCGGTTCLILMGIIGVGLILAIPLSMIVMGAMYKDDCPAEYLIPIYLIVFGVFSIIRSIGGGIGYATDMVEKDKPNVLCAPVDCFLGAWFIAGCVFIYRTKDNFQSHDSSLDDYCDYTLYWFAFWMTTSSFILLGAVLVIGCCVFCIASMCR